MKKYVFVLSLFLTLPVAAQKKEGESSPPEKGAASGVTFIDGESTDEKIRRYLLPTKQVTLSDLSDAAFYEFINQKIQWENNND